MSTVPPGNQLISWKAKLCYIQCPAHSSHPVLATSCAGYPLEPEAGPSLYSTVIKNTFLRMPSLGSEGSRHPSQFSMTLLIFVDAGHLATSFFALHITGGYILLPILILTFLFSKRVRRPPTVINFCVAWSIFSISYSLL